MDAQRPSSRPMPPLPSPVFVAQRPDHVPPESLPTADLERSILSLRRKLRSARQSLFVARAGGGLIAFALLTTGFILLWFGPEPFLERLIGVRPIATTYDVFLWWFAVIVVCVAGGAFGDQLLRGRARLVRGWRHRVDELRIRLENAEAVQRRRLAPHANGDPP